MNYSRFFVGTICIAALLIGCKEVPDYTSDHFTVMTTNYKPSEETISQLEQSQTTEKIEFEDVNYEYMEKYYVDMCEKTSDLEDLFQASLVIPDSFESEYMVTMNPEETNIEVVSEHQAFENINVVLNIVAQTTNAADYRVYQEGITEKEEITINDINAAAYYHDEGTVIVYNNDDLLYIWYLGTNNKAIVKDFISSF